MARIALILAKAHSPDSRMLKQAKALESAGHKVVIYAWDRQKMHPDYSKEGSIETYNIKTKFKSPPRQGFKQLLKIPSFWLKVFKACEGFDIIQCGDFDTLFLGVMIKKYKKSKLIYDAREDYAAMLSSRFPRFFIKCIEKAELFLMKYSDAIITASTTVKSQFDKRIKKETFDIGNYSELEPFKLITQDEIDKEREKLGIPKDVVVFTYIGNMGKARVLDPLVDASGKMDGVITLIIGKGECQEDIEQKCKSYDNVKYLGPIDLDKVPLYTKLSDVMYYVAKGCMYNNPNGLFNALAAGRPIICNNLGDLGNIVNKGLCGIAIDEFNLDENSVRDAMNKLLSSGLRKIYSFNASKEAHKKYNWRIGAEKYIKVFSKVLNTKE